MENNNIRKQLLVIFVAVLLAFSLTLSVTAKKNNGNSGSPIGLCADTKYCQTPDANEQCPDDPEKSSQQKCKTYDAELTGTCKDVDDADYSCEEKGEKYCYHVNEGVCTIKYKKQWRPSGVSGSATGGGLDGEWIDVPYGVCEKRGKQGGNGPGHNNHGGGKVPIVEGVDCG